MASGTQVNGPLLVDFSVNTLGIECLFCVNRINEYTELFTRLIAIIFPLPVKCSENLSN